MNKTLKPSPLNINWNTYIRLILLKLLLLLLIKKKLKLRFYSISYLWRDTPLVIKLLPSTVLLKKNNSLLLLFNIIPNTLPSRTLITNILLCIIKISFSNNIWCIKVVLLLLNNKDNNSREVNSTEFPNNTKTINSSIKMVVPSITMLKLLVTTCTNPLMVVSNRTDKVAKNKEVDSTRAASSKVVINLKEFSMPTKTISPLYSE